MTYFSYPNGSTRRIIVTSAKEIYVENSYGITRVILTSNTGSTITGSGTIVDVYGNVLLADNSGNTPLSENKYYELGKNITNDNPYFSCPPPINAATVKNLNSRPSALPAYYILASGLSVTPFQKIGPWRVHILLNFYGNYMFDSINIGAPNQVTNVVLSNYNGTQVNVTWTKPSINYNAGLGYIVRAVPYIGGSVISTMITNFDTLNTTLSGLVSGEKYNVYVVACSSLGYSIDSVAAFIGPPNQVTGVSLSAYTGTQVTVNWTKPTINTAPGIGYVVRVIPIDGGTTVSQTIADFNTTSTTLSNLSNNSRYTVIVNANSSMGYSIDSAAVAPGAPTLVSAKVENTVPGYVINSATLTWNPPTSFGTATGVSYNATATQSSTGITVTRTNVTSPYVFDELVSGSQFSFKVVAVGAATGPYSNALTATPTNIIPNGGGPSGPSGPVSPPPTALTIDSVSDGSVSLSWTAPSGTITNYKVHVYTDANGTVEVGSGTQTDSSSNSYTVTGLTNSTTYYFRVEAYNGSWGSLSEISAAATPMGTLTSATFVSADYTNGYTLTFALTASSTLPDSSSAYMVYNLITGDQVAVTIPASPANRITMTGLTAFTEYNFDITIVGYTETINTGTIVYNPDVTSPGYINVTTFVGIDGQLILLWPNIVDGGSDIITYYIYTSVSSPAVYTISASSVNTQIIPNHSYGQTYTYYMRAEDAAGNISENPTIITGTFIKSGSDPVVPCFFGNAPVLTKSGYRRMDSLRAGDCVMTPAGEEATIEHVKVTRCAAGPATNPYIIPKGRFGAERRVLISPNHNVVTQSGLTEARHLGLDQEERTGTLTYYNLELTGQAHMVVGGVAVESLAPVRRLVLTMDQFKTAIMQKHGGFSGEVLANIQRTCRFIADGRVEVPVMRKH